MKTPNRTTETGKNRRVVWVRRCRLVVLLSMSLFQGGCQGLFTDGLWRERNPNGRVWIPASQITEAQLQQEGRSFERVRKAQWQLREMGIAYDEDGMDGYLAEKTGPQKVGDSVMLVAGTPVTLVLDGVIVSVTVIFVGILGFPN